MGQGRALLYLTCLLYVQVETDREKAARLSSYNNVQLEKTREIWVPCDYRPPSHPYSAGQRRALYCQKGGANNEILKSFVHNINMIDFSKCIFSFLKRTLLFREGRCVWV